VNKFQDLLTAFAKQLNWNTLRIDNETAEFDLEAESEEIHTLLVTLHEDDLVEFDIPSSAVFETENDIPGDISTMLLKRNMQLPVGAWALEEFTEDLAYSLIWTTTLDILERISVEEMTENITWMVEEVDEFDEMWAEE
jgi:hypothetical protein